MSHSAGDYTVEDAKDSLDVLRAVPDQVVDAIEDAANEQVLEFLILDLTMGQRMEV